MAWQLLCTRNALERDALQSVQGRRGIISDDVIQEERSEAQYLADYLLG